MTASLVDAQQVLSTSLSAGFRESGAVSLGTSPMVAVRSNGLSFDSVVGYQDDDGLLQSIVSEEYLQTLVTLANKRFVLNSERIARFKNSLLSNFSSAEGDAAGHSANLQIERIARREKKRRQGLLRQAQGRIERDERNGTEVPPASDDSFNTMDLEHLVETRLEQDSVRQDLT